MTHWTPELLDRVRAHAAAGDTMLATAIALGVRVGSLQQQASAHRIRFGRPVPIWTPEMFEQVRQHAAAGHSMRETAEALGLKLTTLVTRACKAKISFHGKRGAGSSTMVSRRAALRSALELEIEAAKREAGTAPLYRGGP